MAETFRFALRAQRFAGLIQAFQCGIRRRTDFIHDAQRKTFRQVADDQRPSSSLYSVHGSSFTWIDTGQILAIQAQRGIRRTMTDSPLTAVTTVFQHPCQRSNQYQ